MSIFGDFYISLIPTVVSVYLGIFNLLTKSTFIYCIILILLAIIVLALILIFYNLDSKVGIIIIPLYSCF